MLIQFILVALLAVALLWFLRGRDQAHVQAWKRFGFVAFIVAGVVSVIAPDALSSVAHWVGVGRGADLLLYGLTVLVIFTTLNAYLRFKDLEARVVQLTRELALREAPPPGADR